MVRRDVEEDADRRLQARREVDLKRRHLNDMDAVVRGRRKRQDRRADVAAHLHVAAGLAQDVGDSAVVVDLPLVPVMATNGASGARFARSRQNSSMSPMISTPAAFREPRRPVRLGMGQRHAGREDQRGKARPVGGAKIGGSIPCACAFAIASALSSQATIRAPPAFSARAVASPEPPSPNSATVRPAKGGGGGCGQRGEPPSPHPEYERASLEGRPWPRPRHSSSALLTSST